MANLRDRVKCATATTGTGTVTLGAAVPGSRTFDAAYAATTPLISYVIDDGSAWETGVGTFTKASNTLTRVMDASSTGSLLNLSGSATVSVAYLTRDHVADWPFMNVTYDDTTGPAQPYPGNFGKLFFNKTVTDTHGMFPGGNGDYFIIAQSGVYAFELNVRLNDAAATQRNYGLGMNSQQNDGPWFSWYTTGLATQGVTRHGAPYFRKRAMTAGTVIYSYMYADSFSPGIGAIDLTVERIR